MNKRSLVAALSGLLLMFSIASPAADDGVNARVMTRNLYVGADVFLALDIPDPSEFPFAAGAVLGEIIGSNFPARAERLAQEIRQAQPHAVGLQEVWNIRATPVAGGDPIDIDFLEILVAALADQGQKYTIAVVQTNIDLTLPVLLSDGQGGFLPYLGSVQDRTAILVRHNVAWGNATSDLYAARVPTDLGFDIVRGWTSVDVVFSGNAYRFVNTHLEVEGFGDGLFQTLQAFELRSKLAELASLYGHLPEVVLGDFNSDPADSPCMTALCASFGVAGFTPYTVLTDPLLGLLDPAFGGPLLDTWEVRRNDRGANGHTCCFTSILQDDLDGLDRRVDLIWTRGTALTGVTVRLSGDEPKRRTDDGLFASDHLGVFGRMTLMPAH
jgi:endonuclease/exonuclease/phosphatase family metal-dependent hydrolase